MFWVALLDVVQRLEHETGRRIHVRGQWDNASPHVEKAVLQLIVELFWEYGWEWGTQPTNTPLTNTWDAAMFPALAKMVSKIEGLTNGGRQLAGKKLWEALQQAWNNYPEEKIA